MRIGFDIAPLALNRAGERRYTGALLAALSARSDIDVLPLTPFGRDPRSFRERLAWQAFAELVYYPALVDRRAAARGADLLHFPRHLVPPRIAGRAPYVITVHDVLPLRTPDHYSRLIRARYRALATHAARGATRVLTGSSHSRDEIVGLLGVSEERVVVTPYGVEACFRPDVPDAAERVRRHGVSAPYVLCVGTLEPRKNLVGAVRAFERIADRFPDHSLAVIGGRGRGWGAGTFEELVGQTSARVTLLGYVADEDLPALYAAADCFVFPSFAEGFGFPVLEAMACGTPVVTSDTTSLPELTGGAALLVDPADVDAIAEAVAAVISSDRVRAERREVGLRRAAEYTWERCADATVAAYRSV
jgi:glycosyltransferase involved in cell wall biosynthesis